MRARPNNSSLLTRLMGVAILLMAAIAWPMAALAADPAVETQQNPAVVYIVLILLFAALTSGIFFASPLRSRLLPYTADTGRHSHLVTPARLDSELPPFEIQTDPIEPIQRHTQPASATQPSWPSRTNYGQQPMNPQATWPETSQTGQYPPAPQGPPTSPWSTGGPNENAPRKS
jgi:hypothetical protein